MKRKIYDILVEWKRRENGQSALLIDGARRVGKSWVAEEFAKKEYKSYILIDFSKAPKEVKGVFEDDLENLDTLFLKLSTRYSTKLYVLHSKDMQIRDGITYLPLYMAPLVAG